MQISWPSNLLQLRLEETGTQRDATRRGRSRSSRFAENNAAVNDKSYRAMINEFFLLQHNELKIMWFQQDGATTHTALATIDMLKNVFSVYLIFRFGDLL